MKLKPIFGLTGLILLLVLSGCQSQRQATAVIHIIDNVNPCLHFAGKCFDSLLAAFSLDRLQSLPQRY